MDEITELILTQLNSLGKDVGNFIAGILSDDISRDDQINFAHRLVDIAEAIRDRALQTPGMVIEGGVLDGDDLPAIPSGTDGRADHSRTTAHE